MKRKVCVLVKKIITALLSALTLLMAGAPAVFANEGVHELVGQTLPVWSVIPFVGMLLSIAIVPLFKPEWWAKHMLGVAAAWSVAFLVPFAMAYGAGEAFFRLLESVLLDYVPFIVLLLGLFVVAGGIAVKGALAGTSKVNTLLLFIGTFLASWIGTTGAAMIMIRPIIRANEWRKNKVHMGFQRGVPFAWTFHMLPILVLNLVILFTVFFLIDHRMYKKELAAGRSPDTGDVKEPIRIEGAHNLIYIALIIIGVVFNGLLPKMFPAFANGAGIPVYDEVVFPYATLVEIIIILGAAFLSMKTTSKAVRETNNFSFEPIEEVAKLFIGIFVTMIPALILLKVHGAQLGLSKPWEMFWATGMLSSFLDNTPTYLVFLQTAGALGEAVGIHTTVGIVSQVMLEAISAGAVFMGANTYIGNAPNFMVKSIAEQDGIKMPSFFGYMVWSNSILIPVFIIDTLVFFLV